MKTYIINLARSADRRAHIISEISKTKLEYEFIEAVDGTKIDFTDPFISPTWFGKSPRWLGALGCALSHLKVFNKIIEENLDVALVLEDDVILPPDIDVITDAVAAHMSGAEAVLLQYMCYYSSVRGVPGSFSRSHAVQLPLSRTLAYPTELDDLCGTGAYLVTREACELMAQTVPPVRVPADDWAFYLAEQAFERVRCVLPMPIEINRNFRTTIDHYSPQGIQTLIRRSAAKVPGISQALTWRRDRIMDRMTRVELVDRPADQRLAWSLSQR